MAFSLPVYSYLLYTFSQGSIVVNMSTKHFFHSTEGVVVLGLESLVVRNSHLVLDAPNKVVYSRTHSPSKVTVISGGGAGHEPCWAGMVSCMSDCNDE